MSAWSTLGVVRWLVLLAVASALVSLVVPRRFADDLALALGVLTTIALFYRLLVALPEPHRVLDVKLGGYGALLAAIALTLGAYEAEVRPAGLGRRGTGSDPAAHPSP